MTNWMPSVYANVVSPFLPVGRQPVGQESADLKNSSLKSLEEAAESGFLQNRRLPDDRPSDEQEQDRLRQHRRPVDDQGDAERQAAKERQQEVELEAIKELAARDREVRSHEQAHAAVGGQFAGSPVYQYTRGPDGISYAVSGEVSINTSPIPGDPHATLAKAQLIRRAAHAPIDPSPQDRQVAAAAARMEADALAEIRAQALVASELPEKAEDEREEDKKAADGAADHNAFPPLGGGTDKRVEHNRHLYAQLPWDAARTGQYLDRQI